MIFSTKRSSPPPGATLNYTANQSIASGNHSNNSNNDWNYAGGPRPGQRNAQDTTVQRLLSSSPMPEYWCSILYFELDTQVRSNLTKKKAFYRHFLCVSKFEADDCNFL